MNIAKLAVPALLGLAAAGAVVGGWVNQIIQNSYRTEGTMFNEYAPKLPLVKNPAPSEISFCTTEYKTRWAGCTLKAAQ